MDALFELETQWFDPNGLPSNLDGMTLDKQVRNACAVAIESLSTVQKRENKKELLDWMQDGCRKGYFPPLQSEICLISLMKNVELACVKKRHELDELVRHTSVISSSGRKARNDRILVDKMMSNARMLAPGSSVNTARMAGSQTTNNDEADLQAKQLASPLHDTLVNPVSQASNALAAGVTASVKLLSEKLSVLWNKRGNAQNEVDRPADFGLELARHAEIPQRLRESSKATKNNKGNMHAPMLGKVDPASGSSATMYKSYSALDLSVLLKKLPPMPSGGENWLVSVQREVIGQSLTAGDMRALLIKACPVAQLHTLMDASEISLLMDDEALTHGNYETLFKTLDELFPIPEIVISDLVFAPIADEEAATFIDRAHVEYSLQTGHLPTDSAFHSQVFRAAVLKGIPRSVVQALDSNPDLPGADHVRWLSHLKYYLRKHVKRIDLQTKKHKNTEYQLATMQLQTLKKKEEPLEAPAFTDVLSPDSVGECAVFRSGRFVRRDQCHNCGKNGHWSKQCRQQPRGNWSRGRAQQRGRGSHYQDGGRFYQQYGYDLNQRRGRGNNYRQRGRGSRMRTMSQQYLPFAPYQLPPGQDQFLAPPSGQFPE